MKTMPIILMMLVVATAPLQAADLSVPVGEDSARMEQQAEAEFKKMREGAEQGELAAQKRLSFTLMMMASTGSNEEIAETGLAVSVADALDKAKYWM